MALSKTAINKKYDELRSQLKSGDLSQKQFKIAADRLYKMYHSDANKAQRAKDVKPAAKKTTKATSSSQKPQTPTKTKPTAAKPTASDKAVKGGYTISPEKRKPGTRGAAVQPKAKTKPKKNVRGSGVKRTGKKIDLGKTLKNLSNKFKLTRKAGEVFTVGNMRYVSDGKGGIRSSQRIR